MYTVHDLLNKKLIRSKKNIQLIVLQKKRKFKRKKKDNGEDAWKVSNTSPDLNVDTHALRTSLIEYKGKYTRFS